MDISSASSGFHAFAAALGAVGLAAFFIALAVWSLAWKGVALWFSARNHQKRWFIVLLVLNTAGILPIIYLLAFRRDKQEGVTTSLFNNPLPAADDTGAGAVTGEETTETVAESREA